MAECARCRQLKTPLPIEQPDDLRRATRLAKKNVDNGTLALAGPETLPGSQPFAQLSPAGPWDDVVHFIFACTACGQRFELSAETYHGAGGAWRPL
jgi:hypothetical protein